MEDNSGSNGSSDDKAFLLQLHMRAEQKASELAKLLHARRKLEVEIERTKEYMEQLNSFLRSENQQTVTIKVRPEVVSSVGKPGNRSKNLPVRQPKWEGMSLNEIIGQILLASPEVVFHPKDVAPLIYETQTTHDIDLVMKNIRSTMQRGAREGKWDRTGRAAFKAKVVEKQASYLGQA